MQIGERIKLRCQELGVSPRKVALEAGLSVSFVSEVIKGQKSLGIESAKKLAPVLKWPVSELIGESAPQQVERWFWSARIGSLPEQELTNLKKAEPITRAAWAIRQVMAHYPGLDMPALIGTSPEHVAKLVDEAGYINGQILADITVALQMPPHWLTIGEPGPSDEQVQKVLQHRNAAGWLGLVSDAIDRDVPPHAVRKLMNAYLELTELK